VNVCGFADLVVVVKAYWWWAIRNFMGI